MSVAEPILGLALSFLTKRSCVSNFEMQHYLNCDDETLKWVISQLISENAAENVNDLGLRACNSSTANFHADIFLSYTRVDSAITYQVVENLMNIHLRKSPFPLKMYMDTNSTPYVKKWEPVLMQALKHSSVLAPVISENYFLSEYCKKEWNFFYDKVKDENGDSGNIASIYISTSQEYESGNNVSIWVSQLKQHQHLDLRGWSPDKNTGAYEKEFSRFYEGIISTIAKAEFETRGNYRIPPRRFSFTGREKLLERINALLRDNTVNKKLVLQGLSGIGKTTLAFQYAYLNRRYFTGGCFIIRLKEFSNLRDAMNSIAVYIDSELSFLLNPEQLHSAVIKAIETNGPTLIILDNVDDPLKLLITEQDRYLPQKGEVYFLLTSQCAPSDFNRRSLEVLQLDFFSEDESISLLSKFRVFKHESEKETARRIHTFAGGLPIAIEIIGSYLWVHKNIDYADYCVTLEKKKVVALDGALKEGKDLAVNEVKLFSLIFEDLEKSLNTHERIILEIASYMSPDDIQESWLQDLYQETITGIKVELDKTGEQGVIERMRAYCDEKAFTEVEKSESLRDVSELIQWIKDDLESIEYRFNVSRDRLEGVQLFLRADEKMWRMHHLVQNCIVMKREKGGVGQHADKMVFDYLFNKSEEIITNHLTEQPEYRNIIRSLMSYYEYAMPRWADRFWGAVSNMSFSYMSGNGDIQYSKKILELAHQYLTDPIGKRQISMLLIQVYHSIGDKEGRVKIESEIKNLNDLSYEFDMMVTNKIINAANLRNAGKIDESLHILLEVESTFNTLKNKTSMMFETLATVKNNISILYQKKNMIQRCIQYEEDSISISEELYPGGNLVLAQRYNNLGAHYTLTYDFSKATIFAEKARKIYEKLDWKHSKWYANNLKLRAGLTEDKQAARDLTLAGTVVIQQLYGQKSPYLNTFYNQLATIENQLGNYEAAFSAIKNAIDIVIDLNGEDYPDLVPHYMLAVLILGNWHTSAEFKEALIERYGEDRFSDPILNSATAILEMNYSMEIFRLIQVNKLPEKTLAFAEFYFSTGEIACKRGSIDQAVQSFAFAISIFEYLQLSDPAEQIGRTLHGLVMEEVGRLYESDQIKVALLFLYTSFKKISEILGQEHLITTNLAIDLLKIQVENMDHLIPELTEPVKRYIAHQKKSSEKVSFWGKLWINRK